MERSKDYIPNLKKAWRDEMLSAANYRALAGKEQNPERQTIFIRMAEAEDRHAERWAARLKELGVQLAPFKENPMEIMRRRVLLKSSPEAAAEMLEAGENDADKLYEVMIAAAESVEERKLLLEIQREENAHSKMLQEMTGPRVTFHPQSRLERLLGREHWHVTAGGWIGQAIYGINDGLGAAFGVVSGVAGATAANGQFILLSGLAAAVASALSMGSGAYLATKSEREVFEAEIEREKREIAEHPEEEQEELELFYQLKGFSPEDAKKLVAKLAEQPDQFLKTLAHEELGLSEKSFPNQWKAAISATVSTALGAIIPVLPFIFWSGMEALIISLIISTAAHFAVGASKVIVTGRSWLKSGTEMTLVGLGEAITTYLIGMLIAPIVK
jgi:VIT1/CCC1 family predicted Fe2+/Mn2+ transporter/rubrerythrin